ILFTLLIIIFCEIIQSLTVKKGLHVDPGLFKILERQEKLIKAYINRDKSVIFSSALPYKLRKWDERGNRRKARERLLERERLSKKPINVYREENVLHVPTNINHYVKRSIGPIKETNIIHGSLS
ncbi:hypothetical protein Mgra_00005492, partial [Meloidogyne graminicola]